jgi:hypothetical protein
MNKDQPARAAAKRDECLALIEHLSTFYDETGDQLFAVARRLKHWLYGVSGLGFPLFLVYIVGLCTGHTMNFCAVISLPLILSGAVLAILYEHKNAQVVQFDERLAQLHELRGWFAKAPVEALGASEWFWHRYMIQRQNLRREVMDLQRRFGGCPLMPEVPEPLQVPASERADTMLKTIEAIEEAAKDIPESHATIVSDGIHGAVASLAD